MIFEIAEFDGIHRAYQANLVKPATSTTYVFIREFPIDRLTEPSVCVRIRETCVK